MKKYLVISNSVELTRLPATDIVCIEAEGNYSNMHIAGETKQLVLFQLGQIENLINSQLGDDATAFIRIGRSLIINRNYIYHINLNKNRLILRDYNGTKYTFPTKVSRESLKQLKKLIEDNMERSITDD